MIFWCLDSDCAESQDAAQSSVELVANQSCFTPLTRQPNFICNLRDFVQIYNVLTKTLPPLSLIMTFYYNEVTLDHKNNLFSVCTAHVVNFLNIFKSICIFLIEGEECFKGYLEQFQS